MDTAAHIFCALTLDCVLGDPRWLPHPVKLIGNAALALESPLRKNIANAKFAGVVAVIIVVAATAGITAITLKTAGLIHPFLGNTASILLLYTTFAARDLSDHARAVYKPLIIGAIDTARKQVAMLVGRDTDEMAEADITRATVESVAENCVDGVTAPLIYAFCGGAVAAMIYKAINTLDSTFGYKNSRYFAFGWASARLDDIANFVPARLSAVLMVVAATLLQLDYRRAWRVMWRDHANHPSPNGGWSESACAGALQIRLGGKNSYFGRVSCRPYMGDNITPLRAHHIHTVIKLMWVTTLLVATVGIITKLLLP